MKKRAFAVMLAVALAAAQPVTAMAARSDDSDSEIVTTTKPEKEAGTPTQTTDGQSLATNGAGSKTENVKAEFATGGSATAGLPVAVVSSITSINSGANLSQAVGNPELEGYAALTKTAAVVLNSTTTNSVANQTASVTLYIPNLLSNLQNVKILYYENATGMWKVVEPTAIDYATKTISFSMFGSGTVTVIHK